MKPTPLAWKNLTTDWRRLSLGVAGVAFAAILMFMQNGFRNALLDSPVQLLEVLDCDLVAISVARFSLPTDQTFPESLYERSLADADVIAAAPMHLERMRAQVRIAGEPRRPIRVIAMKLNPGWFADEEIESQLSKLKTPLSALLDKRTRKTYGFDLPDADRVAAQEIELADQSIQIVGLVDIGTDFANDGSLLMSQESFVRYFSNRAGGDPTSEIDLALFRIREGADVNAVAKRLTDLDSRVWKVLPRENLIRREIQFWNQQTPIGMIFFIGSLMGFAVGIVICYQILFNSIHDSLPEFATLKAMGYSDRFFISLVIKQAIYLSILGFIPAFLISWTLFQAIQWGVGLPMLFTLSRVALVLGLTTAMCLISGLLALRRLLNADPASLF